MFHRYLRSLISHCDLIDPISMWFDCRRFRRCVNEVRKTRDDREIENQKEVCWASNVRIAFASIHRCKECRIESIDFLCNSEDSALALRDRDALALRDRDVRRLHSTLLRSDTIWHQVLVVLNTFLWSDIDSISKRTRDCIVRFFEAILSDFKSWRIDCTLLRSCTVRYDVKSL